MTGGWWLGISSQGLGDLSDWGTRRHQALLKDTESVEWFV